MPRSSQKAKGAARRRLHKGQKKRIAVIAILVAVIGVLLLCIFFQKPSTLPGQVQAEIPHWVEKELLSPNPYSRPQTAVTEVNNIVVHYVGNPGTSAAANRSFFQNLSTAGETYASSNFIVGLEGEILQCVPVDEVAYCSSHRNGDTVSIEVCHPDETGAFTEETMTSLIRLTAWLCHSFGLDAEDVIRHYDVTGKECPLYYVQHPDAWEAFKADVQRELDALIAADSEN